MRRMVGPIWIVAVLVISACGARPTEAPAEKPNPASQHCADEGGKLEIRTEADGEVGYCIFPDGSACEEWAFLRGECAPGGEEGDVGLPNPASQHCADEGGKLEIRSESGGEVGYCIFPDGTECEEWAFYRGECAPGGEEEGVGLPNPASQHCEEEGGMLEIRTESGGEVGYCLFPDGTECEEWAFYRGECAPGGEGEGVGLPNPASQHCADEGGKLEIRSEAGGEVGYCLFDDGSECEEWAYYRGECAPGKSYQPLDAAACLDLSDAMAELLGVEIATENATFEDYIRADTGTGCQAAATGTGVDFESVPVVATNLKEMLQGRGWEEDVQYAADGPTGTATAFHQANRLCLLRVGWEPSEDADCPADQSISACELAPEQQLYKVILNCAQTALPPDMPNPASQHCADEGGKLEIRIESGGEVGYCLFDDGSECEEWAFFRGECAPGGEAVGLPNPASVHCTVQGGTLEIRAESGGDAGYCLFPDGSECEEWAFFRGECAPGGEGVGLPNPASVHCTVQGGTLEIRAESGGDVGYCLFDDGSECEEWSFFRGECAPGTPRP